MYKTPDIRLSTALLVGIIAISAFCGSAAHHMVSMPNVSPSCGAGYFLTVLPQSSQERGALFVFLGLLALLALYPIAGTKTAENILREPRLSLLSRENTQRISILVELFRRGILNPKIFDLGLIRA